MTRVATAAALVLTLVLGHGDATATGDFATAFIAGPWPDVRTDAARAQQLAREEARARRPQTTRRDVRMLRGGTRRNAGQSPLARVPG